MNDILEERKPKKTNYVRLWREAKKREVLLHNALEAVISIGNELIDDKKKTEFKVRVLEARNKS